MYKWMDSKMKKYSFLCLMWRVWCITGFFPKATEWIRLSAEWFCSDFVIMFVGSSLTNYFQYLASSSWQCAMPSGPEYRGVPIHFTHQFCSPGSSFPSSGCRSSYRRNDSKTSWRYGWMQQGNCRPFQNRPDHRYIAKLESPHLIWRILLWRR